MFVTKWNPENRNIRKQDERLTTYATSICDGQKIFQIQTYGEYGYESGVKQAIQMDRARAIELIDILKKEFAIDD